MNPLCLSPIRWRGFLLPWLAVFFVTVTLCQTRAQIPAFPGAEGYGAYAKGGRGGDVYHVTNLNPSGTGSFADAIATVPSAGRTIVFDVSGYIRFPSGSNGTRMTASKVTIAGQTAPGDGIGFYNNFFLVSGDDIVIRHLRFRMGKYGSGGDCIDLDSGSLNSIFDHISMEFSTDENMSSYGSAPENLTLQYSINSWGLESHSCGGLWDQNHASSHHNLWAHNHTRNPKSRPSGLLEWINNITFDWDIGFIMGDTYTPSSFKANVRSNYFICPPGNTKTYALEKGWLDKNSPRLPTFSIYLDGNYMDRNGDSVLNGSLIGYERVQGSEFDPNEAVPSYATSTDVPRYYKNTAPFAGSTAGVAIDTPLLAYKKILSNAGALRLDADPAHPLRDEVDTILFTSLVNLARFHVTRESDTGASAAGFGVLNSTSAPVDSDRDGMPDFWETALNGQNSMTFNSGLDDHNTVFTSAQLANTFFPSGTPTGYTYLEEYLYWLAIPHAVLGKYAVGDPATYVDIDLRKFTSGFSSGATYTISNLSTGAADLQADGHTVRFTPPAGFIGRAKFTFTVTDGSETWAQPCGIVVSAAGVPKSLLWIGTLSSNIWDTSTTNWAKANGSLTSFSSGDTALFDDRGSATPAINLSTSLSPSLLVVDSTQSYTFGGSGSLTGTMPLIKSGSGTLTFNNSGTNGFTGGTTLNQGTISANNVSALGSSGAVILNGGTLALTSAANLTFSNPVTVSAPSSLTASNNTTFSGAFTGSGDLTLSCPLLTPTGSWAGYTGDVTLTSGTIRFNQGGNAWGAAGASFDAGATGTIKNRSITATQAIALGALSGGTGSKLLGSDQTNLAGVDTYTIGALNTNTTFFGSIADTTMHTVALTKTGTGTLTLMGASTYTGATVVNAGALLVGVSLGNTAVTVNSGGLLGGSGTIGSSTGGPVTVNNGAFISPGTAPFTGATMNVGNGLTLNAGSTLYYDMSVTTGANDKIVLNGGTLAMTGQVNFQFLLLEGTLSAGTYDLVTGAINSTASSVNLTHNLPAGSRQTFGLSRAPAGANPSYIRLTVTGNTASLLWTGASSTWDYNNTINWSGASDGNNVFKTNDAVTFDDTAANTSVSLVGSVQPRIITVANNTKSYTFAGPGILGGTASLVKSGTGTLTLSPTQIYLTSTSATGSATVTVPDTSGLAVGMTVEGNGIPTGTTIIAIVNGTTLTLSQNATATNSSASFNYFAKNTYSGGTTINAGSTILLTSDMGNSYALGVGSITLNGGTLSMYSNLSSYNSTTMNFYVAAGQTGTFNADSRCDLYGTLTGAGTFNLKIPWIRTTLFTDWSAFTGTINVTTDGFAEAGGGSPTSGDLRMGTSYNFAGFPGAAVVLGDKVSAYYTGTLAAGAGTTVSIGDLSGVAGSSLLGGATGGRALTYRIGGRNGDATFLGPIGEQGAGNTTAIVKTGTGTWTLGGVCTYAGSTTVEQGTLRVSGTITNTAPIQVMNNATLNLMGGTLTVDSVKLEAGATFVGYGTIQGELFNDSTITSGAGGALTVTGDVVNNGTIRFTGGTALNATGAFVNNGVLDLLTGSGSLPANLVNNGVVIDSSAVKLLSATKNGNVFTVTIASYSGHDYLLQRSDTLTSPTSWQTVGSLQNGVTQSNGQPTTLTFTDNAATGSKAFYRIKITP